MIVSSEGAAAFTLDEVWAAEVDRLVPSSDRAGSGPPQPMIDAWQRHRFFEGLVHAVLAPRRPTLLTIDDVQWCDAETLTWLNLLLRHGRDRPLLVIATTSSSPDGNHPRPLG